MAKNFLLYLHIPITHSLHVLVRRTKWKSG